MKQRAGLGKKVSSIFDGVPLPKTAQEIEQEQAVQSQHPEPQYPVDGLATSFYLQYAYLLNQELETRNIIPCVNPLLYSSLLKH